MSCHKSDQLHCNVSCMCCLLWKPYGGVLSSPCVVSFLHFFLCFFQLWESPPALCCAGLPHTTKIALICWDVNSASSFKVSSGIWNWRQEHRPLSCKLRLIFSRTSPKCLIRLISGKIRGQGHTLNFIHVPQTISEHCDAVAGCTGSLGIIRVPAGMKSIEGTLHVKYLKSTIRCYYFII